MQFIGAAYKHLKFFNRITTLRGLIWGVWGGFILGLFATYYHKNYVGEVVRRLIKNDATSPEKASSIQDIGMKNTPFLRLALRDGSTLRKSVSIANADECGRKVEGKDRGKIMNFLFPKKEKFAYDFSAAKLFIPEKVRITAEVKYEEKHRMSPVFLIVFAAVLTGLAIGVTVAVPDLLQMLDNFLAMNLD